MGDIVFIRSRWDNIKKSIDSMKEPFVVSISFDISSSIQRCSFTILKIWKVKRQRVRFDVTA